jgi:hypothetical protein
LTISQAQEHLARLGRDLKTGQMARINLGWLVEEGGKAS